MIITTTISVMSRQVKRSIKNRNRLIFLVWRWYYFKCTQVVRHLEEHMIVDLVFSQIIKLSFGRSIKNGEITTFLQMNLKIFLKGWFRRNKSCDWQLKKFWIIPGCARMWHLKIKLFNSFKSNQMKYSLKEIELN